ncbi:O-succinylbenzoic acid--CoA ligase [Quadrisphaera granulorum]|uniref:O-succinylbenzoic acid--CoA ligase n=1 Tax=Quadrisphaera granulorum TaxID=317664 RepID=A0A315ZKK8_9ACTN|nr:o-succinylbenzoate--CoA ligase [Quadrisphaera granulorum]PWJ45789.1 O-succinylbenzoic acid--CoA ligase [Quadrisphaera granulorum]SZE99123.1 O-succinylbenzoic acid--CoA ligase [Quadrisphaera granulorum]
MEGQSLREVVVVAQDQGRRVPQLLGALRAALEGSGPALLPLPADSAAADRLRAAAHPDLPLSGGAALVLATSGSTGEAKAVELSADALVASARATATRLGGHGRWLLALPLEHVAAWQVLVRSAVAGTQPVVAPPGNPIALPGAVAALSADARGLPLYASLVPTQLARALELPEAAAALARLDAVLLGGAAAPAPLLVRAEQAGVRVVRTYGSTETSGGCVYDGWALDGVAVALEPGGEGEEDDDDEGRVLLSGPVLATGYRGWPDLTAETFVQRDGRRWYATSDLGRVDADGRLSVLGRLDDVVVTGGRKVAPLAVERVLAGVPGVADVLVVGVPDPEWGQRVVALVVPAPGSAVPSLDAVRGAVRERLGAASAPRAVVAVDAVPVRGIGKPDRRAAAALAVRLLATPS